MGPTIYSTFSCFRCLYFRLQLFYVDRVIHFARPIPRLFPAFRGWSKELLNQREFSEIRFGGFGRGVIELPEYDVVHADGVGNPTQGHGEDGGGCSSPVTVCVYGPKTFAEVVAEATTVAARSIRELLRLVKNASDGVFDGKVCGQLREAIQVLVRLKLRVNCTISAGSQPSQSTFSQREDIFWSKEENIRAIEDIERAIMERNEFMDMPSFSLGLTQDFNDVVRAGGGDNEPVCGLAGSGRSNGLGLAADLVNGVGGACASPSPLQGADVNLVNPAVGSPVEDVGPANIGVGNLCYSGDMAAPPAAGGAEIVGQVSGTEVELEGTAVAPDEVTPFVEPADQVIGDDRCRSDGAVCGAPLKTVRAARPPPDAVRGIGPLGEKSDGTSDLAVGSLPDSPDEAVIVNWLLAGGADNMEEVVFCIGSRLARWDDLLTLVPGSEVGVAVIDAWASLLNQRERVKAPVVDGSHDRGLRVGWFRDGLKVDQESSPYEDLRKVDLMFFPIIRSEHYFLICFDFRRFRMEIIDNSSSPGSKSSKYGESLIDMQDMLQEFFTKSHPGRSILCAGLEPKQMQIRWRVPNNKIDCGVYLMRHMESFAGQPVKQWNCGLVKGDQSMLHKLRLRYMKELAVSEYNIHNATNVARAYQSINAPLASL
nr:uncharacterized protein LOC109168900 [Ipomoea batatas]